MMKKEEEEEPATAPTRAPAPIAPVQQLDLSPQIAELANQVKELKEVVNILVSQITALRGELKEKARDK